MSKVYTVEPPTSAKVSLKTTVGDIDIELWTKECPKTCQNFMQLCTEGYYDNTIFHRVIKGFVVHGGDPNGDGSGGQSIFGKPFKDEFHRRLRYTRRGLVGMLNFGKNDNGSQFFFTLAATPDLQNKNTLFGRVTDDTIFNMLRLEVGALDQNKRPINLQKIIRTEIISNPFDEILPNVTREEVENKQMTIKHEKRVENFELLSFDDPTDEDEDNIKTFQESSAKKLKTMHDMVDDPRLSEQTIKIENLTDDKLVSGDEEFGEEEKDITVEYNNIKMEDTDSDDVPLTQEEENKSDDINRRAKMISNKKQIMALVSNMKKYPAIAQGSCRSDLVKSTWQTITNELNSLGPPIKTWDKWVKVWIDLKAKTKKKLIKYRANSLSIKRNPKKLPMLTATEDAINNILSLNSLSGEENPPFMKLSHLKKNESKYVSKIDHQTIVQPLACITKLTPKKEKVSSNYSKINRVEKQQFELEQDNCYNKIYRSVKNIESILISSFKNEEQYRKEKLALKREKLRVYEENAKKKHKYRMLKLKLKAKKKKMDSFHVDHEI